MRVVLGIGAYGNMLGSVEQQGGSDEANTVNR